MNSRRKELAVHGSQGSDTELDFYAPLGPSAPSHRESNASPSSLCIPNSKAKVSTNHRICFNPPGQAPSDTGLCVRRGVPGTSGPVRGADLFRESSIRGCFYNARSSRHSRTAVACTQSKDPDVALDPGGR